MFGLMEDMNVNLAPIWDLWQPRYFYIVCRNIIITPKYAIYDDTKNLPLWYTHVLCWFRYVECPPSPLGGPHNIYKHVMEDHHTQEHKVDYL